MKNNPARTLLFLVLFLTATFGAYTYTQNNKAPQEETLGTQDVEESTQTVKQEDIPQTSKIQDIQLSYPKTLALTEKQENTSAKYTAPNASAWNLSGTLQQSPVPLNVDIIVLSSLSEQDVQSYLNCIPTDTTKCSDIAIKNVTFKNITETIQEEKTNITYITVKEKDLYVFTTDADISNQQEVERAMQSIVAGASVTRE